MRRPCIVTIPKSNQLDSRTFPGFVLSVGILQDGDLSSFCMLVEHKDGTCDDYSCRVVRFTDDGSTQAPEGVKS